MRAILLILILAVVVVIALVATGLIDIRQVRGAKAPDFSATSNGVTAKGGQTPSFDIETGTVSVGTRDAKVKVPAVTVNPAGNDTAPAANQAAPVNGM